MTDTGSPPLARTLSLAVHELRTPVTVVAGYLRMLLREQAGPLSEKQRKMIEEADRSCARIGTLVAEMSDLGRLDSREISFGRQEFDLSALAKDLASDMLEGRDRGVQLEYRSAEGPVPVAGDRARIAAVVQTIVHAALRERGEPGVVVAACAAVKDSATPWAVLAVGTEAIVSALIEGARGTPAPFDEWRGGLGLALPIGRRVLEAHGGALWSAPEPRPRAGSALRLPLNVQGTT